MRFGTDPDMTVQRIREGAKDHSGIPFWSWNDKLEKQDLNRQMKDMKSMGMRGFFMHARSGLETEYLSDDWFDKIEYCMDEAKKLGMEAWAYDENGWPSGFAGGKLLRDPKNFAAYIELEYCREYPVGEEDILGVYTVTEQGVQLQKTPCTAEQFAVIRRKRDFSYVDVMNPEVTAQFLEEVHELYRKKLGEKFRSELAGFFTDEPQYFRYATPWSDCFLTRFQKRFGYSVLDGLPALFLDYEGAREFRYDYHLLCHESYYNCFCKPIYDWCESNGKKLTGHTIEEWGLAGQMRTCGGVMPFYCYEHIPGIDYIFREFKNVSGARQLGSVCAQTGKKVALTETFAGCGWNVTPRQLKRIAEIQFAGGANLICEHLYAYSIRGQRKRDFPCFYSEHNPWFPYFKTFETYFKHLGSALSLGTESADTLVIHPIRSAYLDYKRFDESRIAELDEGFKALTEQLSGDQIPFHFGDETMMKDLGSTENGQIRIGNCCYRTVILPLCYTLDASTVTLLKGFLKAGGRLWMADDAPDRMDGRPADLSFLKSNITYEDIKNSCEVTVRGGENGLPLNLHVRHTETGRLIFLANFTDRTVENVTVTVNSCGGLERLNLVTLEREPVRGRKNPDGSFTALLDFEDAESCLLLDSGRKALPFVQAEKKRLFHSGRLNFFRDDSAENMLTLDSARISLNGGSFSEERPIVRIRDNLFRERFEGTVTLRYSFEAKTVPEHLTLVLEPMHYTDLSVNGIPIHFTDGWRIDRRFRIADIAEQSVTGENTVDVTFPYWQSETVYDVLYGGGTEARRNCLKFDTEVEAAYLYGNFEVESKTPFVKTEDGILKTKGPFALTPVQKAIHPEDLVSNGYPFFAGELSAEAEFDFEEDDGTVLKLGNGFSACRAEINGTDLGWKIFGDTYELKPYLKPKHNLLRITLCISNRNLLGPHHQPDGNPVNVTPKMFSFEKMWDGETCPQYCYDYAFVKSGIDLK